MKQRSFLTLSVGIMVLTFLYVAIFGMLGRNVEQQLSSVVGMYASIEPNEYNTLAQQIKDKQEELVYREEEIAEKELLLDKISTSNRDRTAIVYITAIGSLLLALVVLNFILDWRRRK